MLVRYGDNLFWKMCFINCQEVEFHPGLEESIFPSHLFFSSPCVYQSFLYSHPFSFIISTALYQSLSDYDPISPVCNIGVVHSRWRRESMLFHFLLTTALFLCSPLFSQQAFYWHDCKVNYKTAETFKKLFKYNEQEANSVKKTIQYI